MSLSRSSFDVLTHAHFEFWCPCVNQSGTAPHFLTNGFFGKWLSWSLVTNITCPKLFDLHSNSYHHQNLSNPLNNQVSIFLGSHPLNPFSPSKIESQKTLEEYFPYKIVGK